MAALPTLEKADKGSLRLPGRLKLRPTSFRHVALFGAFCFLLLLLRNFSAWGGKTTDRFLVDTWEGFHATNGVIRSGSKIPLHHTVLIVTAAPPDCLAAGKSGHLSEVMKNHADYARMHGFDIWFMFDKVDPEVKDEWNKVALLKKLMKLYPYEYDWFWWLDHESLITDLNFRLPLEKYENEVNLIFGPSEEWQIFRTPSHGNINLGTFLIRSDPWSLNFLERMESEREKALKVGSGVHSGLWEAVKEMPGVTERAVLLFLLYNIRENHKEKEKIVFESISLGGLQGSWKEAVEQLVPLRMRQLEKEYRSDVPFVINFGGCKFCLDDQGEVDGKCHAAFRRAYNYADDQVLASMRLQHVDGYKDSTLQDFPQTGKDR